MEYLAVNGSKTLGGTINVQGAKNSVLPVLAATVLISDECIIHNVPALSDVYIMLKILRHLGAKTTFVNGTVTVNSLTVNRYDIPSELMSELRSSIVFLGAVLSKMRKASLCLPGGCEIGLRPVNMHLDALRTLGCDVSGEGDCIFCSAENIKCAQVFLPYPSVGATENTILASVLTQGRTVITNCAKEPEIIDLCSFLKSAGAKIYGAGTSRITVEGVKSLHKTEYTVIPDRIAGATFMSLAAITGSTIEIKNVKHIHLINEISALYSAGCKIYLDYNSLVIKAPKRPNRIKRIVTKPYPAFPTDSAPLFSAVMCRGNGVSSICETVFENRFMHLEELKKFGADIKIQNTTAYIKGKSNLHCADVNCTDLRGGAAVVIAALSAEGISRIYNIKHIDRGYEGFEKQLQLIGADVKRINNEKENERPGAKKTAKSTAK